ncbi:MULTISPECIES: diacylglycerol kinase family protein [unclassified Amycolatopsis]|uniref:diacylglycerol/lipid kinase family protein n=1 Tax=unclassified Amycolatopsis TaxID=2618356 RepID=UPI001C69A608|nr:YegS/Rv2252/BmrU family lipid kinase [Amycolatopsis sp. DSM 110486]QYN19719.1 YegS/Rv2252/BmrU family lipid kinase [Amycolatopsis sp. DSM 110486]
MGLTAALAVHPASGHGAAARIADAVAARLRPAVERLDVLTATSVEESRALMRSAHAEGLDVLIVLGGDGAAHQGVQFCADHDVALGLVPSGTGNDFARALGTPPDALTAAGKLAEALRAGTRRTLDLGRLGGAEGSAEGGGDGEHGAWFATVLCSGFDAAVNARANSLRWPSGPRRYDVAILAELAAFRPSPVTLHTDEGTLELDATLVAVGNTPYYGGGVPICPQATPDDGLFDVTVIGAAGRLQLLRLLPGLRTGAHLDHPAVRTLRTRTLSIETGSNTGTGPGWPAYADGESQGTTPVTATCVPGALTVVAP